MRKFLIIIFIILLGVGAFFVIRHFRIQTLKNVTAKQVIELYNPRSNVIQGNPHGRITMVEFFGYNCRFCRKYYPVIQKIVKQRPELRVVYKEYLVFGDRSKLPCYAALAANLQGKYLAMHDAMLTATKPLTKKEIIRLAKSRGLNTRKLLRDMNNLKIKQQIDANTALMAAVGLQGAPTAIFVNSDVLKHPEQASEYKQYVRSGPFNFAVLNRLIAKCAN